MGSVLGLSAGAISGLICRVVGATSGLLGWGCELGAVLADLLLVRCWVDWRLDLLASTLMCLSAVVFSELNCLVVDAGSGLIGRSGLSRARMVGAAVLGLQGVSLRYDRQ